ncbi:hypothetical protein [Streptomyces sp. Tu 3180]|uniref:hypothetical protein n=1 Tax=Streptomyces sp. Tu 3180 TaxID=2682611 RepID=UPI00135C0484|nr:hypothetical protein [Streptomyces sp. Tu 3180]KAF3468609.1 hypothetical protein GL259_32910 [Streptomyces sp. Tu 3180]
MGRRKVTAAVVTAAAAVTTLLGTAAPANAAIHQCMRSGSWINCTTVTGIDPGSYLMVRTGPGYAYGPIDAAYSRLYNGNEVGLSCWKLGDGAYDNPGYRYWMSVELTNSRSGWVNDWYLNTGHPDVWKQQIRECRS